MKTPPLKWLLFLCGIVMIWTGVFLYYDMPEKPAFAVAAWITSFLSMLAAVLVAIDDTE